MGIETPFDDKSHWSDVVSSSRFPVYQRQGKRYRRVRVVHAFACMVAAGTDVPLWFTVWTQVEVEPVASVCHPLWAWHWLSDLSVWYTTCQRLWVKCCGHKKISAFLIEKRNVVIPEIQSFLSFLWKAINRVLKLNPQGKQARIQGWPGGSLIGWEGGGGGDARHRCSVDL